MQHKFVVRLLDAEGALLSWTTVYAEPKPQDRRASCPFWPTSQTQFVVTQAGTVSKLTIHWADLDVARVRDIEPTPVVAGQVFNFFWTEPVWLVAGMHDVPLPPVTVGAPVEIGVAPGTLGAASPT